MVGVSAEQPGVRPEQVEELRDYLYTSFFHGVTADYSEFSDTFEAIEASQELGLRRSRANEREGKRNAAAATRRGHGSSDSSLLSSSRLNTGRSFATEISVFTSRDQAVLPQQSTDRLIRC